MNILSLSQLQKIDDRSLYEYCQFVGKEARIWKNQFVALLPEVAKRELHKKKDSRQSLSLRQKSAGLDEKPLKRFFRLNEW